MTSVNCMNVITWLDAASSSGAGGWGGVVCPSVDQPVHFHLLLKCLCAWIKSVYRSLYVSSKSTHWYHHKVCQEVVLKFSAYCIFIRLYFCVHFLRSTLNHMSVLRKSTFKIHFSSNGKLSKRGKSITLCSQTNQHFLSLRVASNDCCCCVQSIQTFCFREKTNDQ